MTPGGDAFRAGQSCKAFPDYADSSNSEISAGAGHERSKNILSQMSVGTAAIGSPDVRTGVRLSLEHVRDLWCLATIRPELGGSSMPGLPRRVAPCRLISRAFCGKENASSDWIESNATRMVKWWFSWIEHEPPTAFALSRKTAAADTIPLVTRYAPCLRCAAVPHGRSKSSYATTRAVLEQSSGI